MNPVIAKIKAQKDSRMVNSFLTNLKNGIREFIMDNLIMKLVLFLQKTAYVRIQSWCIRTVISECEAMNQDWRPHIIEMAQPSAREGVAEIVNGREILSEMQFQQRTFSFPGVA